MKIGEKIKEIRINKGFTKTYVSKKTGVTIFKISSIERGDNSYIEDIQKISKLFKIPLFLLLYYCVEKKDVPKSKREQFLFTRTSVLDLLEDTFKIKDYKTEL